MKINVGQINGQRVASFHKRRAMVLPRTIRREWKDAIATASEIGLTITAAESFRRWKIGRKAWRTRKNRGQEQLPL